MRPDLFREVLKQWPDSLSGHLSLELGLSGGIDSVVLLDLLARGRSERPFSLCAVHVHHGLSPHADRWVEHCRALCEALNVPLRVHRVKLAIPGGMSLEAVAREARYGVYRESRADCVVLAHHADDQSETQLLQLLRGGGVRALAGMPTLRDEGGCRYWRPLLGFSREEIEAYAVSRALSWVEDESNADVRWRRNFLRHDVFPRIARAVPEYRRHLARSAALMADAAQVLEEVAGMDLETCEDHEGLDLGRFSALSAPRQRLLLVAWLGKLGAPSAAPEMLEDFRHQVLVAGEDRSPSLTWGGVVVFRYRGRLRAAVAGLRAGGACPLAWPDSGSIQEGWEGRFVWSRRRGGLAESVLEAGLRLVPREGGERVLLEIGHKRVKTLLQEWGIPPALRAGLPLLVRDDGRIAAVPGVAVALDARADDGWWPDWLPDANPAKV
ncbi:tRNA lysidine(34) synthetase TilS [Paludibacterium paludis]|uniref:tRNA(Ile)-lysidine synthase n=1 Tax=Paludibacterium paludis TaxID=1225769 RepID=A0A918UA72_9NEIS|nr:tRNA lysidine(34) synthetase TilS [Paludibacterium paludis]GGY17415.1 tRNA(Ile)-lysidine synthase [Paludibacterium paludis]